MSELIRLELERSKVEELELTALPNLRDVRITDDSRLPTAGLPLANLRTFEVERSAVSGLTCDTLRLMSKLNRISLVAVRGVEKVDCACLPRQQLYTVEFSDNPGMEFDFSGLRLSSQISSLELRRNALTSFNISHLPKSVHTIYLDANHISSITCSKKKDAKLRLDRIGLDNNRLEALSSAVLGCLPVKAEHLNVAENRISSVDCDQLGRFTRLITLNLRENRLTSFDPTCPAPGLEVLQLSGNLLTGFDLSAMSRFESRVFLTLYENPI